MSNATALAPSTVETVDAEVIPPHIGNQVADGLRAVAAMLDRHEDISERFRWQVDRLLMPIYSRDELAAWIRAGKAAGAEVRKHQDDKYAGVDLAFGLVKLHVYVGRDEVCERIVTGTREVTEEVPDPEALAAVPKVTVTKTVEDVEWRCHPILAAELPAGGAS